MAGSVSAFTDYQSYINKLYAEELGQNMQASTGVSITPALLSDEEARSFQERYKLVQQFLKITSNLFRDSFADPSLSRVKNLIINESNKDFAETYHDELYKHRVDIPQFFRTDEPVPGKIAEIQSPASGWGYIDVLQRSIPKLRQFAEFPIRDYNQVPVSERVAAGIKELTNGKPRVFHQLDCSSHMVDMSYFLAKTRRYGIHYLGRDHDVNFKNVNLVRSHDVLEMVTNIEFTAQLKRYYAGELRFDLFPNIVFDEKISLMFPYWSTTRDRYSDAIRGIFPFASLLKPNGITLEDGSRISIEDFANLPATQRGYFLKYASASNQLCWGSKGIFNLASGSHTQCLTLLNDAMNGYHTKRYWLLQKAYHRTEEVATLENGSVATKRLYSKYSGFYGPLGFMGGFVMSRASKKVHGQDDTVTRVLL